MVRHSAAYEAGAGDGESGAGRAGDAYSLSCVGCAARILRTSWMVWLISAPAVAQVDSAPHILEEIVVVSHATPTTLRESIAATTVLTRTTIDRLPARTLSDLLRYVPGLIFVDRDGAGELPMAIVRGFFGGGEAEYIYVTIDDIPVNDLRTGLVDWTQVRASEIERIEVLRGGASAIYGDAALGAVINVVTRMAGSATRLVGEAALGGRGDADFQMALKHWLGADRLEASVGMTRSSGFREQSPASSVSLSGVYWRRPTSRTSGYLRSWFNRHATHDPGPLTEDQVAENRRQSNPLFAADDRRRIVFQTDIGIRYTPRPHRRFLTQLRLGILDQEQTRTLLLSSDFGDTQLHHERNTTVAGRVQYQHGTDPWSMIGGLETEVGSYDSKYFALLDRRSPLTVGSGRRLKIGVYGEVLWLPMERWRAYLGARFDNIVVQGGSDTSAARRFHELSPRLGLNFAYSQDRSVAGNLFVSWTRSFKAPTLDQLYDVRVTPSGAGAAGFSLSNPALRPQHSLGWEAGLYQRMPLWSEAYVELSLSIYRLDLADEIDFDLATFRFGNIQESRHDGVEGSVTARISSTLSFQHSFTVMWTTFRSGVYEGNRLKNMPRAAVTNSIQLIPGDGINATVTHRFVSDTYLDDANSEVLAGRHLVDVGGRWRLSHATFLFTAQNLIGTTGNSSGFLLFNPVTSDFDRLVYPAAGPHLRVGVQLAY